MELNSDAGCNAFLDRRSRFWSRRFDHIRLMLVRICERFQVRWHILSKPFFCFWCARMKPMVTVRIPFIPTTCRPTWWTKEPWTVGEEREKGYILPTAVCIRVIGKSWVTGIRITPVCVPWIACHWVTMPVVISAHGVVMFCEPKMNYV